MNRRPGWWAFALGVLEGLTAPAADTPACDRALEQLARASRLGSLTHRVSWTVRRAWLASRVRAELSRWAGDLTPAAPAAAVRVRAAIVAVAGATAFVLNAAKPMPVGPLSWIVPAALLACGLLAILVAGPLASAIADRRPRHDKVS